MTDNDLVDAILAREGSAYTNDPADQGGPTKYGITLPTLAWFRETSVEKLSAADVEALDEFTARCVYHRILEGDPIVARCAAHPVLLELVLDMVVNHGQRKTIVLIQRALGLDDDGVAGPVTVKALEKAAALDPLKLAREILVARVLFRATNTQAVPGNLKFLKGWLARDMAFVSKLAEAKS